MEKNMWKKVIPLREFSKHLFCNIMNLRPFIVSIILIFLINSAIFFQSEEPSLKDVYKTTNVMGKSAFIMFDYLLLVRLSNYIPITTCGKINALISSMLGFVFIGIFIAIAGKSFEDIELKDPKAYFF